MVESAAPNSGQRSRAGRPRSPRLLSRLRATFSELHEVEIVAEVADASRLANDRTEKLRVYAQAGFPEYWIVKLVEGQLQDHGNPLSTGAYGEVRIYGATDEWRGVRVIDLVLVEE